VAFQSQLAHLAQEYEHHVEVVLVEEASTLPHPPHQVAEPLEAPWLPLSPHLMREPAVEEVGALLSPQALHPPPWVLVKLAMAIQLALASLRVRRVHLSNAPGFQFSQFSVLLLGHPQEQAEAASGPHQSGHLAQPWAHVVRVAVALNRPLIPEPGECLALVVKALHLLLNPQLLLQRDVVEVEKSLPGQFLPPLLLVKLVKAAPLAQASL